MNVESHYLSGKNNYLLIDEVQMRDRSEEAINDFHAKHENMVAIELIRRGYEVYTGTLYDKEVDFIAIKRSEKLYIQVSDDISAAATFTRETEPLLKIGDAYPKLLVARTNHETYDHEGIQIIDIANYLVGEY